METRAHHLLIGTFAIGMIVLTVLFLLWIGKIESATASTSIVPPPAGRVNVSPIDIPSTLKRSKRL